MQTNAEDWADWLTEIELSVIAAQRSAVAAEMPVAVTDALRAARRSLAGAAHTARQVRDAEWIGQVAR